MKNKKGVSLPVNVLVILAIAVIVLVGLISFFSGSMSGSSESISNQQVFSTCCTNYIQAGGCSDSTVKASGFTCQNGKKLDAVATDLGYGGNIDDACGC
ncbi:MAG: hypothetical protein ABEK17_02615 [Candidatus Aenigmatarchaeota archaeon]